MYGKKLGKRVKVRFKILHIDNYKGVEVAVIAGGGELILTKTRLIYGTVITRQELGARRNWISCGFDSQLIGKVI